MKLTINLETQKELLKFAKDTIEGAAKGMIREELQPIIAAEVNRLLESGGEGSLRAVIKAEAKKAAARAVETLDFVPVVRMAMQDNMQTIMERSAKCEAERVIAAGLDKAIANRLESALRMHLIEVALVPKNERKNPDLQVGLPKAPEQRAPTEQPPEVTIATGIEQAVDDRMASMHGKRPTEQPSEAEIAKLNEVLLGLAAEIAYAGKGGYRGIGLYINRRGEWEFDGLPQRVSSVHDYMEKDELEGMPTQCTSMEDSIKVVLLMLRVIERIRSRE